jgi:hypothetical protein
MSTIDSRYDPELQMFADEPREADLTHLRFLRWLAEHRRLQQDMAAASGHEELIEILERRVRWLRISR